jgi:sugar phosphate permease
MWAPGAVGLTVGILLLLGVRDSPESVGYKPVEPVEKAKKVCCPVLSLQRNDRIHC